MTTTSTAVGGAARSTMRKWVLASLVVGAVAAVAGAGTFASFSASTSNDGNVFSTGAIELSNTKESGTTCVSGHTGPGGAAQANLDANGNACDSLIDLSLARPGEVAEGHVSLQNTGDYDGLLQFFVPGSGCASATVATPAGSGNLCDKLEVYIQETQSDYATPAATECVFPYRSDGACATDFGSAGDTLSNLADVADPATAQPATAIELDMNATRYFVVKVNFADGGLDGSGNGVDNAFQNRSAAFGLTWRLQEA